MINRLRARATGLILNLAKRALKSLLAEPVWASPDQLGKAESFKDRAREVISDPINILIKRVPNAGFVDSQGMVILHNGNRVPCIGDKAYYGEFSDLLIFNRGVHEPLEEFSFQEVLKKIKSKNPIMIELGSYWAHYSMWFLKELQGAIAICVEPEINALEIGKHNFQLNGLEGIHINAGIGNDGVSLQNIFDSQGLNQVCLLHCDIQGAEAEMLAGAKFIFESQKVDYAFISTHSETLHSEVVKQLQGFGYRIEISSPFDHHTTSCDGFVLAVAPAVEEVFQGFSPLGRVEILESSPSRIVTFLSKISQ